MKGCLLIHGFTGGPFEVMPLAQYLQDKTDWKISIPTLPGHETEGGFEGIQFSQWVNCAEMELTQLLDECDEVFLIGFSMGGIIATHLASVYPVDKLVLLSAAYHYVSPVKLMQELLVLLKNFKRSKQDPQSLYHRLQKKSKSVPITTIKEFQKLVHTHRSDISKVTAPTFLAHGLKDCIVPPISSKKLFQKVNSMDKQMMWIDNCNHLICLCEDKDILFEKIDSFLKME